MKLIVKVGWFTMIIVDGKLYFHLFILYALFYFYHCLAIKTMIELLPGNVAPINTNLMFKILCKQLAVLQRAYRVILTLMAAKFPIFHHTIVFLSLLNSKILLNTLSYFILSCNIYLHTYHLYSKLLQIKSVPLIQHIFHSRSNFHYHWNQLY